VRALIKFKNLAIKTSLFTLQDFQFFFNVSNLFVKLNLCTWNQNKFLNCFMKHGDFIFKSTLQHSENQCAFITNFTLYPDWHKINLIRIIMFQPITLMKLILIFVMQRHHIYNVQANNCLVSCYSLVSHNENSAFKPFTKF
jgi:hypothetical protein